MNRRYHKKEKRARLSVVATLILPMLLITIGSTVYAEFMMTSQIVCTTSVNSGDVVIEITGWNVESTNTIDVDGNGVIIDDELEIVPIFNGHSEIIGLNITVDPIFPGWNLDLEVDIHNTLESIPVHLYRTIFYFDNEDNPVETDEAGLLNLYRIIYSDAWYNTTTGEPIPDITTHDIWPCQTATIQQSLAFDGQDYPELQGVTFSFLILITATYPTNGG